MHCQCVNTATAATVSAPRPPPTARVSLLCPARHVPVLGSPSYGRAATGVSLLSVRLSSAALRDTAVSCSVRPHLPYNISGLGWSVGRISSRIAIARHGGPRSTIFLFIYAAATVAVSSPPRAPPTRAATGVSLVSVRQTRVCPARHGFVYDLVLILSVSAVSVLHFNTYIRYCTYCGTYFFSFRQEGGVSARVSAVFVSLAEKPVVSR